MGGVAGTDGSKRRFGFAGTQNKTRIRSYQGVGALLMLGFLLGGCIPLQNVCTVSASSCSEAITEVQVDNPRFEFPSSQPIARGQDFWLSAGDTLNAAWDGYVIFIASAGAMCSAATPPSPPACQRCDMINFNPQHCSGSIALASGIDFLTVSSFAGFASDSAPADLVHINSGIVNQVAGLMLNENATLQLSTSLNDLGKLAEARVFVLTGGTTQQVSYPLTPLAQNVPDVVFYSGAIPQNPVPADNFSSNLRIGKVRVLKGEPDVDPITGKYRLKDAAIVRPSRVVFIPNYAGDSVFANDSTRCYSDLSPDGDLDLTRCRQNYGATSGILQDATPGYLKIAPQSPLTWVAEFRPTEGGVAPTLDPGESLAIEFTIQ